MKPSEITAQIAAYEADAAPLRKNLEPLDEQIQALKAQKASIVNANGIKIRRIGAESKMKPAEFVAWRNGILGLKNDDAALEAIDAKMAELGLT